MDTIFEAFILIAIMSILLALISLITEKTVFFLKNPTTGKALIFWFTATIVSVIFIILIKLYVF